MRYFKCDFLNEGMRYSTFPVDFLKAQTIFFHKSVNHFNRISKLIGVKSRQNTEGFENHVKNFLYF